MTRYLIVQLCVAIVFGLSTPAVALAQSDQQKAQNLATCLGGKFPSLCKHEWLTSEERLKVDVAERQANLQTCLTGKFPSLCNHERLTSNELVKVSAAEHRENLRTCMTGQFPSLCNKSRLTEIERSQVNRAEQEENLRRCTSGRTPAICNHSLLTNEQRTQVQTAERRFQSSTPSVQASPYGSGKSARYTSACEDGHWVQSVSSDGTIVKLEDGSVWEVDASDAIDSALWLPTTEIIACNGKLINTDDNEKVSAERLR